MSQFLALLPRFRQLAHGLFVTVICPQVPLEKCEPFPLQGPRLVQINTFPGHPTQCQLSMFQTKSPEKGFVFHFSILGDGVVLSGFVCFLSISFPPPSAPPFGLV